MACRQVAKKSSVLLQLANLERFRERTLLAKSPKLNIGSNFTGGPKLSYAYSENLKKKNFTGQNYWHAHNISKGRNNDHGFGSNNFGIDGSF